MQNGSKKKRKSMWLPLKVTEEDSPLEALLVTEVKHRSNGSNHYNPFLKAMTYMFSKRDTEALILDR